MTDDASSYKFSSRTQRWFQVLTWLPLLLIAAAIVAAEAGSEVAANLFGLFAGLGWLVNGVMLWGVGKNQGSLSVCVSSRKGWRISTPLLAMFFILIGASSTIQQIVRLS